MNADFAKQLEAIKTVDALQKAICGLRLSTLTAIASDPKKLKAWADAQLKVENQTNIAQLCCFRIVKIFKQSKWKKGTTPRAGS